MRRWTVADRDGRTVYLTEERWEHITERHPELIGRVEDVLATVRFGRREQDRRDPRTYLYRLPCRTLPAPYTVIVVVVAFRFQTLDNATTAPNNFVVTSYGTS